MTRLHVLGYFVIVALLVSGLVGLGGGGTSEAAPLLGFTDTPPPVVNTLPPPPTNTPPPPPPPTHTAVPQPTDAATRGKGKTIWSSPHGHAYPYATN